MELVNKYAPLCLVLAMAAKATVLGISGSDALIGVALVGLISLREVLEKNKRMKEVEETTAKKIEEMKNAINAQNTVIAAQAVEFDKLRGSISGIKMQFGQKDTTISNSRKLG